MFSQQGKLPPRARRPPTEKASTGAHLPSLGKASPGARLPLLGKASFVGGSLSSLNGEGFLRHASSTEEEGLHQCTPFCVGEGFLRDAPFPNGEGLNRRAPSLIGEGFLHGPPPPPRRKPPPAHAFPCLGRLPPQRSFPRRRGFLQNMTSLGGEGFLRNTPSPACGFFGSRLPPWWKIFAGSFI